MNAGEVAQRISECFDEDQIAYAIGGALALGVWGAPRATNDVDVSVFVASEELPRVLDSLERAGVMIDRTAAASDLARVGWLKGRLGIVPVDVFMSEHPLYVAMKRRARRIVDAAGRASCFITAEDLCVLKLVLGRLKDFADLERLFAVRQDLDRAYIRSWVVQMVPAGDRRLAMLDELERRLLPA